MDFPPLVASPPSFANAHILPLVRGPAAFVEPLVPVIPAVRAESAQPRLVG
jgi:hypothetical protein